MKTHGQTKKKSDEYKTRNWVTVVYPESAPENWRETLSGWCVPAFVSPLHDADMNPDGEPKKAHWHVLVMWHGPKPESWVAKMFEEIGGVGCKACNSAQGYARYLCHMDNPEKHQYDPAQVESYGGADYLEVTAMDSDRRKIIGEMMDWCSSTGCISFRALCDYARENNESWFRALCSHSTMIMYRYLRSMEHEMELAAKAR